MDAANQAHNFASPNSSIRRPTYSSLPCGAIHFSFFLWGAFAFLHDKQSLFWYSHRINGKSHRDLVCMLCPTRYRSRRISCRRNNWFKKTRLCMAFPRPLVRLQTPTWPVDPGKSYTTARPSTFGIRMVVMGWSHGSFSRGFCHDFSSGFLMHHWCNLCLMYLFSSITFIFLSPHAILSLF